MFFGGRGGSSGGGGFGFNPFEEFTSSSQRTTSMNRPQQGNDIQTTLRITFMEAVNGCTKTIPIRSATSCTVCSGTGIRKGTKSTTCSRCNGAGVTRISRGMFQIETTCTSCGGLGKSVTSCDTCHGDTLVSETRTITVTVPAGVDNTTNQRLVNQGDAGYNNGPRGHLWIKLLIDNHQTFKRDGTDIHITVPLSLYTAIVGGTVEVPTLQGTTIVKIPPGTQPKDQQIMRNKGIKVLNRSQYGNQYIHFDIKLPSINNVKQSQLETCKKLLKQFISIVDPSSLSNDTTETNTGTDTTTNTTNTTSSSTEKTAQDKKKKTILSKIKDNIASTICPDK